jgi:hypothetical protein
MQIIRRKSTARRVFDTIINITAAAGYVLIVVLWIWWRWYTEGGPK